MKRVSLLVTTYNAAQNLPFTFQSIEAQDYKNIEVVIVDGGSSDATVSLIKDFARRTEENKRNNDRSVIWISEPDEGLYDAMNKAYSLCRGDIIAVCNDRLCVPCAVSKLVRAIEDGGEGCIGAHSDLVYEREGQIVRRWHMGQGKLRQGWMPGHPTLFLKKAVYEKYGAYDISYRCAADYEFMVRFLKEDENRLAYVPEVLVSMYYGGTSNAGLSNYMVSFLEGCRALKKNKVKNPLWITVKRTIKVLKQF